MPLNENVLLPSGSRLFQEDISGTKLPQATDGCRAIDPVLGYRSGRMFFSYGLDVYVLLIRPTLLLMAMIYDLSFSNMLSKA